MRFETTASGIRITIDRPHPLNSSLMIGEVYDFSVSEAMEMLRGLPEIMKRAREEEKLRQQYERRQAGILQKRQEEFEALGEEDGQANQWNDMYGCEK